MITSGYALVGRTIPPYYFNNEKAAFTALSSFSNDELVLDGNMAIWKMVDGVWYLHYEATGEFPWM